MNIESMRFEFTANRVAEKSPADLGRYIADMSGSDEQLEQVVAFVDAVKGYNKVDGEAFQNAFMEARASRAYSNLGL